MKSILKTLTKSPIGAGWSTYLLLFFFTCISCVDLSKPQEQDQEQTSTGTGETGQAASSQQSGQVGTETAGDQESTTNESVNPTDFFGTYQGTIPCEDCDGIKTILVINNNETFKISTERLGSQVSTQDNGRYKLEENGGVLHLLAKDTDLRVQIAKDKLLHLNKDGQVIKGPLAEQYIYKKVK